MRYLDLAPALYTPPSLCGFDLGIGEALGAAALAGGGEAAAAGGAAAATAAEAGTAATVLGSWSPIAEAATVGSSLPSLSTIGTVASVGGSLLQAKGQMDQAAYDQAVAKTQAQALQQKSNEDAAAAERQQIMQNRRTGLLTSRARALAAASGTDATSPTEVTNEGNIAQQGEYNAQSALYQGLSASRADQYQAQIDLFKANRIGAATLPAVGGTILSGLSSFADKRARLKYFTSDGGDTANSFFGFGGV